MGSYKDAAAGGGGGRGAGEVTRRIDVVYFLSRGGTTDHAPHLFRVNHRSRGGGVRLRDVKRWLSEIRAEDMPDNFSWSYKRKYKQGGYVWQDLKDDDLITPVDSDNEYVLKGCDVRGTTPPRCVQPPPRTHSLDETKRDDDKTRYWSDRSVNDDEVVVLTPDGSDESSPKPPPPADDRDSPENDVPFNVDVPRSHQEYLRRGQSRHRRQESAVKAVVVACSRAVAASRPSAPEKQRGAAPGTAVAGEARPRMRVARALHNLLTCGAASDADDAALRPVARRQRQRQRLGAAEARGDGDWTSTSPGVGGCGLRVGRKARSRRGGNEQQGKRDGGKRDGRDAHKPVALPRCSQCGKEFKPQELHSHMQSCRGLKERMRSNSSSTTGSRSSVDRSRRNNNYSAAARSGEYRSNRDDGHCCSQDQEQPSSSSASAVLLLTYGRGS